MKTKKPRRYHYQSYRNVQRLVLDYASYVILERAVPAIEDGFKPVQRRIMHSMKRVRRWSLQQSGEYCWTHDAISSTW